jgi:hypothetical protein
MDARRLLLSVKAASRTTKVVGMGLAIVALAGSFAACSAKASSDEESSSDSLNQTPRGRLPYTMRNYIK